MTTYFISRHQGAKDWAQQQGIQVDQMLSHLELENIQPGDTVIGTLPVNLVAELNEKGARYLHLTLVLPEHFRGKELSAADMEAAGARLEEYRVELIRGMKFAYTPPPAMSVWQKIRSQCKYARETRAVHILFVVCMALLILLVVRPVFIDPKSANTEWWNWAEPIIGFLTLGTALSVWLGELRQDWENNLPKRLNVFFHYKDHNRLICKGLRLADEGDIRALAQQVGKQMNENNLLEFEPFIMQEKYRLTTEKGKNFKEYTVRFKLLEDVGKEKSSPPRPDSEKCTTVEKPCSTDATKENPTTCTPVEKQEVSPPKESKEQSDLEYLRKNSLGVLIWRYDVDGTRSTVRD